MVNKVTTTPLTNLQLEQSAINTINNNVVTLANAFDNTLSRDGTSPNTMLSDLDMNNNQILNLPAATTDAEPVRKAEFDEAVLDLAGFAVAGSKGDIMYHNGTTWVPLTPGTAGTLLKSGGAGANPVWTSFIENATNKIGVGTTSPIFEIHVMKQGQPILAADAYSASGAFTMRRASGTVGTPTAVTGAAACGVFDASAYGDTAYKVIGRCTYGSEGAVSDTSAPGFISFSTVPSGSTTLVERLRITSDGSLNHRSNSTTIVDTNSHLSLRSYTVLTLPVATTVAQLIYVSNGTSNKRLAVSDGTNWRWPDGAIVS